MPRCLLYMLTCLFLVNSSTAQIATTDSAWFDDYFSRLRSPDESQKKAASDSLDLAGSMASQKKYSPAICRYHIEKAAVYVSVNKNDSAIHSFETAIRIAEKERLNREGGDAYLGLANLYQFNGNTLDAATNYLQAVKLLKDLGRKRSLIAIYRNLNSILNKLKQKNGALQNMLTAIETGKSSEADLVKIINTRTSEEEGLNFPDQTLVREGGRDGIYVIFGGAKFPIMDFRTMASYGASRDVQRIPTGTISLIPDFPRNGSIVMELFNDDAKPYLVKDGLLYHLYNPDVLEQYGGWDAVYYLPKGSLKDFPKSTQPVTMENVNTIFNIKQEFDNLGDSINAALRKNSLLSSQLSQQVAERNQTLQQRKTLLWVTVIGIIALLCIVLLLIRNFRQKQKVLKAEEELRSKMAIEKERTRIATDMHDDLGAGLSRIKFLSETIGLKKQQQQPVEEDIMSIREYSHEMIGKMGEIVWALNEKNDSLNDLLSYTRSYAVEYLSQNGIGCKVIIADHIAEQYVTGEFRRNIYLSVKEALHNVVKHAQAKQVLMKIETGKDISISIHDDGIGYGGEHKPYSNGVTNMKQRMKNINGEFEITNDNGTTIKLSAPLPL